MGKVRGFGGGKPSRDTRDAITRWDADHRPRGQQRQRYSYYRRGHGRPPLSFLRGIYGIVALGVLAVVAGGQPFLPAEETQPLSGLTTSAYERPALRSGGSLARERPPAILRHNGHFPLCAQGRRVNCVVDGDTFWLNGEKIRISDIDAPEVSDSRGRDATLRLQKHLNAGRIELRSEGRNRDRYGRSLRTVHVNGRSVGETMVREGHARRWD